MSSANTVVRGDSYLISSIPFISIANRKGLRADPWLPPPPSTRRTPAAPHQCLASLIHALPPLWCTSLPLQTSSGSITVPPSALFHMLFLQLPLTFSILPYQRKHINNAVYHRCIFINLRQNCMARSVSLDARIASSYPIHIRFVSTQEKGPGTGLELCASFFLLVMSHMWSVPQGGEHSFPFEQYIVVKLLEKIWRNLWYSVTDSGSKLHTDQLFASRNSCGDFNGQLLVY